MKRVRFYRSPKPSMLRTILLALGALVTLDLMAYSFNRPNQQRKYRMPDKDCLVILHMKNGKKIPGMYRAGQDRFWATYILNSEVETYAYPVRVSNMNGWSLR